MADIQKTNRITFWFLLITAILLLSAFFFWLLYWRFIAYTDDAYVEGNQVYITPLVPGFITSIHTDDTFLVKQGQLLVELDKTDAEIALGRAEEHLAQTVRNVCQSFHDVFAYAAEMGIRRAEFVKASEDYDHRFRVIDIGGVSIEDYEHAVAALKASFFSLRKTETFYERALSMVQGTSISTHPLVLGAAESLRFAWVNLYRCKIYSPVEGLAAQRKIQVGMHVKPGQLLLSVIPLDQIWVNANYKETQMKKMKIGQSVKITSDLYGGDVVYRGMIVGLPGAAGNAFSLLPPQNLSGNWIKIVQRLPVRVALETEKVKQYPLRLGLSMEATVDLRNQSGLLVPTSSEGSPTYETPIFTKEERGDIDRIVSIIQENADPLLLDYLDSPIQITEE